MGDGPRFTAWKPIVLFLCCAVVVSIFLVAIDVGVSCQVRLDTGDRRYLFLIFPVGYGQMRSEAREALLSLNDSEVPKQWVWCARSVGSNNADIMVSSFYADAAAWVSVDPAIARAVVRDLARYLRTTHATHGLPECDCMLWPTITRGEDGRAKVPDEWQENAEIQGYLAAKGYACKPSQ